MEFLHTNNGVLYCGKNPIILRGMGLGGWLLVYVEILHQM